MTPRQFEKISVFQLSSGRIIGFHNENLEVAFLTDSIWEAIALRQPCEQLEELKKWSDSVSKNSSVGTNEQKVRTLTVNATQLCNLKCIYCAAGGDGTYGSPMKQIDLSRALPQVEWLMARCLPGDRFQVNYIGGEPLLFPDVVEELSRTISNLAEEKQLAIRFSVVTNGTRLNEQRVLDLLVQYRMAVTVSVDGPSAIQDIMRPKSGGGGSSGELEAGLFFLLEYKNKLPSIGLSAVFHKGYTSVLDTYRYFRKWDVDFYEFTYSHTESDEVASQNYSHEISLVSEEADRLGGEEELRKIRSFDGIIQRLDDGLRMVNFCGSGKSLLAMDSRGDLYACPWDINEKNLKLNQGTGILDAHLKSYQRAQVEKIPCQNCWARFVCGGGCSFTHKKNAQGGQVVDLTFCDRTRHLIANAIMYYEKYRRS